MGSLKSFIKAVRKSKTIADERAAVKKESAAIRTSFRDSSLSQNTRRVNISKLLYLYILGEKTHFGQVECLKLLASPRFSDKRLGYLATMLLLDENQEVLTLLTNSLDNDLQHSNPFIAGLALCCLGNIASPELARDLYPNVEKLITSNNAYLKKKASIVAAKLVNKDPELAEIFLPHIDQLVNDKLPGPLLGSLTLLQALYYSNSEHRPTLMKTIPKITKHLKKVATSGFTPDYDVVGVTDPFLQVTLLSTIRVLASGPNCPGHYLEQINDILTEVASNIDSGKNASNTVLYECVKTVLSIESSQSLKLLSINLLGKFLSTKDNNTRYVAFNTLLTVVDIEPQAVQRHRVTITSCLADGDISIRRRALELSFAILNEENVRVLVREILAFLENTNDNELKPYITSQLAAAASKYSPNDKWHFDTLTRMLKLSGGYVSFEIISNILALIMQCKDVSLKKHVVLGLLSSCVEDQSQFGLAIVAVWCLGEYGDLVLGSKMETYGKLQEITEDLIINLFEKLLNNSIYSDQENIQLVTYILTAIVKLSIKFKSASDIEKLRLILNTKCHDNNLEIQIRATEYQELFVQNANLKKDVLARMPPPKRKEVGTFALNNSVPNKSKAVPSKTTEKHTNLESNLLLDLVDEDKTEQPNRIETPLSTNEKDLLSDIFSDKSTNTAPTNTDTKSSLLDLFSNSPASRKPESVPINVTDNKRIDAYKNEVISISFIPVSFPQNGTALVETQVKSLLSSDVLRKFQLLIAVPKSQKLSISTISGGEYIEPMSTCRQFLKLEGKKGSKIKLRIKATYELNGKENTVSFDWAGFERTL